jgi:DNA-binding transcriptional LysR family regulator
MPKSTVSRQVARLEEQLETRLLHRTTRRLSLTETGRAYFERCREALTALEEAERVARDASGKPKGTLRVSAPFDFARGWLAPLLGEFREQYPNINLRLTLSQRRVDIVSESIDVAFRGGLLDDNDYVSRKISGSDVILCASPQYLERRGEPSSLAELAEHDTVAMGDGRPAPLPFEGPEERGVVPGEPWLIANEWGVLLRALCDGLGIGPMIDIAAGEHLREKTLVRVLPTHRVRAGGLYAVYPSRHHLSLKVRVFVDFVAERLKPTLALLREQSRDLSAPAS